MKQTVQPIVPSEGGDVGRPCAGGFAMTESVCKQSFVVAQLTLHLQKSTGTCRSRVTVLRGRPMTASSLPSSWR